MVHKMKPSAFLRKYGRIIVGGAILLLITHRKNIGRLIHHTESKTYLGKRKAA